MKYVLQLIAHGDVGEWEYTDAERADRAFNIFKRKIARKTAGDGLVRTVRLLSEVASVTAAPADPVQPSPEEIAAFDRENTCDPYE